MPTAPADWLKVMLAAGATDTTPTQRPTADLPPRREKVARTEIGRETTPQSEIPVPVTLVVGPIPARLVSEANRGGKLRERIARKTLVKEAVKAALPAISLPLPLRVTLTRYGHKKQDDDNLRRTLKSVRDVVASWIGVDDADRRVRWVYRDRPGWASGVSVEVRTLTANPT